MTEHDWRACPGCFLYEGHPLIGTEYAGGMIAAVRTVDCPSNGTEHTWVLPVAYGFQPHIFDWTYLRE